MFSIWIGLIFCHLVKGQRKISQFVRLKLSSPNLEKSKIVLSGKELQVCFDLLSQLDHNGS